MPQSLWAGAQASSSSGPREDASSSSSGPEAPPIRADSEDVFPVDTLEGVAIYRAAFGMERFAIIRW